MTDMFERLSNMSSKRLALLAMELQDRLDEHERARSEPVAVIGMGCRLPGASNPDEYWQMLLDGVDAIAEIPPSRWDVDEFYDPDPDVPGKSSTRWAGMLDDVDMFEPEMFGISPREAKTMDPQQRLLLEVAWETLEHAGISPDSVHGSQTGAYVGVCNTDYARLLMDGDEHDLDMYLSTGNAASVASGRLSYVLGLQGPAMTIDTACSSSLVAVHLAVQAVRSGACRMALAGGVNVILSPQSTIILSQAKMMAADGRCKTFDAAGDGFVRGEGCGLVALKRLSDAQADGDRVLAVIRGSAVNQDGRSNGLTAPNGPSQVAVLRAALADAGIEPHEVGYVEAHGTGTPLGDPIEVQSLGAALGAGRDDSNRLIVGSAKSNFGHLESAAGIAGLIKLILTVQHGEIPPLLHLREPNPHIPWNRLPIDVPTERTPWTSDTPRIGGVSSFGFSGTNAHVLVEAAPHDEQLTDASDGDDRSQYVFALSARTPTALADLAALTGTALIESPDLAAADVERTLNLGRSHLPHRLAVLAPDVAEAGAALLDWAAGSDVEAIVSDVVAGARSPDVGFLFTGHGSHYPGMGRALYDSPGPFRDAIERCEKLLTPLTDEPLTTVMYDPDRSESLLTSMAHAQPAVFAIEYALAELWRSWGLRPTVVAGHSVGEYVAAVVAGAMSLEDGIRLVAARGRLMATLPPDGEMATVFTSEERVRAALAESDGAVSIAAINGPNSIALSGTGGRLQPVLDDLRANGVEVRPLAIPIAAHSPQIDPILDEFEAVAATVEFRTPHIDVISGMTGEIVVGDDLVSASYWRRHLRQPVRFADAFTTMHSRGVRTFVEVGPHPTLLNMARHIVDEHECRWLASLRNGRTDLGQLHESVARLHVAGVDVDWARIGTAGGAHGAVVSLPTYPFERDRHWAAGTRRRQRRPSGQHPLLGGRVHSPALHGTVFENDLSANWPAFLDHHRVYGTALMPSPAYLEMVLAAGWLLDGPDQPRAVTRFEIREGLVLPDDGERTVQVVIHNDSDDHPANRAGDRDFEIFSRPADDNDADSAEWTLHATGRLVDRVASPDDTIDIHDVQSRCSEHHVGADYYERLAELGLEFGRSFRGVADVWRRDGEALGRVVLPDELHDESAQFGIHPAMLDACFHVLGAAMGRVDEQTYLLIGVDEFRLHTQPGSQMWNHTVLRPGFEDAGGGIISGDIKLFGDDGTLVAEALGLHLRVARRDALMRSTKRAATDWTYEINWQESASSDSSDEPVAPHRWIVVGRGDGLGSAVTAELESRSVDVVHVDDVEALNVAAMLSTTSASIADGATVRILHIGTIDHPNDATAGTVDALSAFQQLLSSGSVGEIWYATRGAMSVTDERVEPTQAAVWGLGRVIAIEHPELWGGQIDLDPNGAAATDASTLIDAIDTSGIEDQLALRGDRRLVPRLVRTSLTPTDPISWRDDASYLVTGGLGALGLRLLDWLAQNGAGTIVLTGRTGLPERADWDGVDSGSRAAQQIDAIRGAEARGATVVTVAADISDANAMDALFGRFGADLAPLAGVVHAATVLGNATTDEMSADDVRDMFRPKVVGTELLHELTKNLTLDFFVLFSSTSALWGSRLLGHYAAANSFLDATAAQRQALGLPALSIDWGIWEEMGATSNDDREQVAQAGMHPMAVDDALACLGELLGCRTVAQVAVADVDWAVLKPVYEARRIRPLLASVSPPRATQRSGRTRQDVAPPKLAAQLADTPAAARQDIVVEFLRDEVALALGVTEPRSIDIDQGLFDMGMDSLMSVELKNRVETALGTNLPSTVTFNYPNIAALAGYIVDDVLVELIGVPSDATVVSKDAAVPSVDANETATPTEDLSEDELATMLANRLSKLQ